MEQPNRQYTQNQNYRYGFNGKENDREWGTAGLTQDYGFRLYNPAIARFLSVDPLAPDYPELTTYQFAGNMPINSIDLDGAEPLTMIDKYGKLTKPIIAMLKTAFRYSEESLKGATWVKYNRNKYTQLWADITKVPNKSSASTGMGNLVIHDNDQTRKRDKWLSLIIHEQSHMHEIYFYGPDYFVVTYLEQGAKKKYRDIPTEKRAYDNDSYINKLLSFRRGEFFQIFDNPSLSEDQKAKDLEVFGAKFRRDVILDEYIDFNLKRIYDSRKLLSMGCQGGGCNEWEKGLIKDIEQSQKNIEIFKNEQDEITKKYGK